jgi:hypothetical protein
MKSCGGPTTICWCQNGKHCVDVVDHVAPFENKNKIKKQSLLESVETRRMLSETRLESRRVAEERKKKEFPLYLFRSGDVLDLA